MGKTTESVTQLIFDTVDDMRPLYEGLAAADQRRMDKLFKRVIKHKVAIANAKSLLPFEAMCALMLLEVYKEHNEIQHAQYEEIKRLRKALEAAGLIASEEGQELFEAGVNLNEMLQQLQGTSLIPCDEVLQLEK